MINYPKVTIVTLVYNTGKFVVEALEYIKKIDYPNIENIIIDDFSTDGISIKLVGEWIFNNNYECIFIKHENNWGINKTLNQALNISTGKYLIYCSDDILESYSIKKMVKYFENLPEEYGIVYSDISIIDSEGSILQKSYFESKNQDPNLLISFSTYLRGIKRFPTIGAMYRMEIFHQVGLYDENLFSEDVDMHLRILEKFKCSYCNLSAARYRRHSGQLSQNQSLWYISDRLKIYKKWLGKCSEDDELFIKKNINYLIVKCYLDNHPDTIMFINLIKDQYSTFKIKLIFILINLNVNSHFAKKFLSFKNKIATILSILQKQYS